MDSYYKQGEFKIFLTILVLPVVDFMVEKVYSNQSIEFSNVS